MSRDTNIQKIYDLAPMQEGMLFHALLADGNDPYMEQTEIDLKGFVDPELFQNALNKLVERHDILRTVFIHDKLKKPQQIVLKTRSTVFHYEDVSHLNSSERDSAIRDYTLKDREKGFNVSKDILVRIAVFKLSKDFSKMVFSFHHIIMDGWSLGIFFKELLDIYGALRENSQIDLESACSYEEYIRWLGRQNRKDARDYWKKYLEGYENVAVFPKSFTSYKDESQNIDRFHFSIDEETVKKLEVFSNRFFVTMGAVIQSIWGLLLSRYNNTEDVVFGSVTSGRSAEVEGIERMVGLFINTVPLRLRYDSDMRFSQIVKALQEDILDSEKYGYIPLAEIQGGSTLKNGLIDHVLAYENFAVDKELDEGETDDLVFSIEEMHSDETVNYDFSIKVSPGSGLEFEIIYNKGLYDENVIRNIEKHFKKVVYVLVSVGDFDIGDFDIVTKEEQRQLLLDFNDTFIDCPDNTIHGLFEEMADRYPDKTALIFKNEHYTYSELNKKANRLAHRLIFEGVCPDDIIAIMVNRSIELVVGILAILKAGCAYLPLDPEYPARRLEYMLYDSKTKILLKDNKTVLLSLEETDNRNVPLSLKVINIDSEGAYDLIDDNPVSSVNEKNLAYMIYTSGSTGRPKGVMIEHKGMASLKYTFENMIGINSSDRIVQFASSSFDASVWEIFMGILTGASLYLVEKEIIGDYKKFQDYLNINSITVATLPPTYIANMDPSGVETLRILITAGSAANFDTVGRWNNYVTYINAYGPTESTVCATFYRVLENYEKYASVPIGKPITNTRVFIVDSKNRLMPAGIPGELCISASGLARGYFGKPELTDEKFIQNPFIEYYKAEGIEVRDLRLYRTGDLARWLPDGNVEFLGRIDHQVKIRGFRIELGEIEEQLLSVDGIKQAVVIDREDSKGDKCLCAYYVSDREMSLEDLKNCLSKDLPEYMLPSFFVKLDSIPLTVNDKVDRKALPDPVISARKETSYLAARNETEEKMVKLFEEILEVEKIGVKDNFFDLGGHSLKATVLISRVHKEFDVQVPLKEVFTRPTVEKMCSFILGSDKSDYEAIEPAEASEYYPLSAAQKRLYIVNQLEDGMDTSYNMVTALRIEGELDRQKVGEAFEKLVERHEVFRTSFHLYDGEPVQKIHDNTNFRLEYFEEDEVKAEKIVNDFVKPFDLTKAPLVRVGLIKTGADRHILIVDMHHIISDGGTMGLLVEEFMALYTGKELKPLRIQYKDYAVWQNKLFKTEKIKEQEKYWLDLFKGDIPVLSLPADFKRPTVQSFEGDIVSIETGKEVLESLKDLAKNTGTTMFMVLLASFYTVLFKYSGQEDIVVGTSASGRNHADIERIAGMFVNTLALRSFPQGDKSFQGFLEEVRDNTLKAFENQDYQFEELVERLNVPRDISRNPLFDVMFTLQNQSDKDMEIEDLNFSSLELDYKNSMFDISLDVTENEDSIFFALQFCTALFRKETMERLIKHLLNVIDQAAKNPSVLLSDINILSLEEKEEILESFNGKKTEYDFDKTVHTLFEAHAGYNPQKEALVFGHERVTYKELNENANRIARFLIGTGFKSNGLVGIMLERSPYMIQGIMGVWKAGGAYIPLDVNYPVDRKLVILGESKCSCVITMSSYVDSEFKFRFRGRIICLDIIHDRLLKEDTSNPCLPFNQEDLAYVLFTSGSTGNPKGVMIPHRGMINHILAERDELGLDSSIVFAQNANHCFDISVWQMFAALALGGTTVIYSNEHVMEVGKFTQSVIKDGVTLLEVVPSYLSVMMDYIEENGLKPERLNYLMVTGETVQLQLAERWFKLCPGIKVVNAYGPAEASDDIAQYVMDKIPEGYDTVPIGKALSNIDIYIMDKNLNLCPVGVIGEICVAGAGVGKGYINNPEKTRECFVKNPVCDKEEYSLLYRTGDIGRFLADGNIEFFGRKDYQVKIRGFRIELGEIEARISSFEKVKDAVVTDLKDDNGNKYLTAYFTSDYQVDIDELKEYLLGILPDYMVPAYFIRLDTLPLSPNGKIDRKALPKPEALYDGIPYRAPETEVEKGLVKIWEKILNAERVGVNDDFFNIGGHSLKAAVMTSMIHKEFNVQVPLKEIFKLKTIKNIANLIEGSEKQAFSVIEPAPIKPYYPLSSAQKRLFIVNRLNRESLAYNMPEVLQLDGMLEVDRFKTALNGLVKRHESLRTSFDMVDEQPVQIVHEDIELKLEFYEADNEEKVIEIIDEFIRPFDLEAVPVFRSALIRLSPSKHVFIYDMHHIISDGSSLEIFAADLADLYDGHELPELKVQYKDFAVWQNKLFESGEIEKQKQYWLEKFSGEIPQIDLPLDYKRPSLRSHEGDMIEAALPGDLTEKLRKLCQDTGTTLYIMLMACYNVLLSKYSGQEDIVIGTLTAGRSHADVQNVIGMFVNTLAMRNHPSADKTFISFLSEVRENALNAFQNQDYQFEQLVESLELVRETGRNPLFDTMFVMQNVNSPDTGESGLKFGSFDQHGFMTSRFDISIQAEEREDELIIGLVYCKKLFKKETMETMAGHFINIIDEIAESPEISLKDIKMMSPAEKREIVEEFNKDVFDIPAKTIQEFFEIQVKSCPDRTAVVLKEDKLSFSELNKKANSLARLLRHKGITRNSVAAIMVERSIDMIVGILGILKAGGAYLPIDPSYPKDRIEFMLSDSGSNLLLTNSKFGQKAGDGLTEIFLDDIESYKEDSSDIELINAAEDLCYVIYTSGTTGKPKGVLIEHRNVAYLVSGLSKIIYDRYDKPLKVALFAPYVFDASVKQIFACLLLGHTLCLVPDEIRWDVAGFVKYYRELGVEVSDGTPTLLNMLMEGDDSVRELKIRHCLIGGEALPLNTARRFFGLFREKGITITNVYGPTECCVDATYFHMDENTVENLEIIPIGKPMPNANIFILGKHNELLYKGAKGEICIGGSGVGRGYLNRDELNNEKFITVTIDEKKGPQLVYKTGDVGKWLADGTVDYCGRYDDQVKIRGHRIELGEIEKSMQKHELIRQAVVIDREGENGAKYLCAYMVAEAEIPVKDLREFLAKELPHYMIPSYFMMLDSIPLTKNGKLDKKALPEPILDLGKGTSYMAPAGEIQNILIKIWEDVLGAENIGTDHDFFELGGDSIKSIQIASRLRKHKLFMDVRDLFENPTIDGLSPYIKPLEREIFQGTVTGHTALNPIQKDFFARNLTDMHHYNQAVMLHNKKGFDENLVMKVFEKIVGHHDALRMVFMMDGDSVTQYNRGLEGKLFDIDIFDFTGENNPDNLVREEASKIQGGIDLKEGPLVKLGLFKTIDGDHLLICIHHLVVDGVSWRILLDDFILAYEQSMNNEEIEFQLKTDSFKDWCDKLQLYADSKKALEDKEYWKAMENREFGKLPCDHDNTDGRRKDLKVMTLELDEKNTGNLMKDANNAYNTQINDLLLAALGLSIGKWTGSDNVLIGMEGHGRENILEDMDITRTIGWFTSLYPVILDVSRREDIARTIKLVKENLNSIPHNGVGYGILKYVTQYENKEDIEFSLNPELVFNYLGEFGQDSGENDIIDISNLSSGDSASENMEIKYSLEIVGELSDGRLNFNFYYDSSKFDSSTIERIIEDYRANLLMIADHCLEREGTEITPSDLTSKGLSIDDLDNIFEILEDKFN